MGRLVAGEDLQDAASSVRQEEEPLVILGVGNSSHDHGEEVGILRGAVEQQARKLSNSRSSFTVDRSREHLQERDLREADLVRVALSDPFHRTVPSILLGLDEESEQAEVMGEDDVLSEPLQRVDEPLVGSEQRLPVEGA